MTIEEFARTVAALKHFGPKHRAEVLARKGTREQEHAEEERRWTQALVDAASAEDNTLVEAFGLAFASEQRRLREEKPPLSSLGPLPVTPGPAPTPVVAPTASAPSPSRVSLEAPGYLKGLGETNPPAPHEVPAPSVDETVIGGLPSSKPIPFQGARQAPPAALPVTPSPEEGGTVMVPLPGAGLMAKAAVASAPVATAAPLSASPPDFDPDQTAAVMLTGEPTMPFVKPDPSKPFVPPPAPASDRPATGKAENPDETVMVPLPLVIRPTAGRSLAERLTPAAFPDLTIAAYAELHAEIRVLGDQPEVWSKAGVATEASRKALQEHFFVRFREDPAAREEFEARLRRAVADLNRRR